MPAISPDRIASRRQSAEIAAWTGSDEGERVAKMTDAEVASLIVQEDAEAAALADRDKARDAVRLAALGLAADQVVHAAGRGAHYDSHGAEVIELEGGEWRIQGVNTATDRVVLAPVSGQGHYALVRPEQIIRDPH